MQLYLLILLILLFILITMMFSTPLIDTLRFYINEFSENKNQIADKIKYRKKLSKIEPDNNFEIFYKKIYDEEYNELENRRKKYRNAFVIQSISGFGVLASFAIIILSLGLIGSGSDEIYRIAIKWGAISTLLLFTFFILLIRNKNFDRYYKEYIYYFKNNVVGRLIKNQLGKYEYNYGQNEYSKEYLYTIKRLYEKANFNGSGANNFHVSDYISTISDSNMNIILADVKDNIRAFGGIFSFIQTNNRITERICIVKNNMGLYYKETKVTLDSKEFEQDFDVFCNNNILALQILTSDTMIIIKEFYEKFGLQFEIIIEDGGIYLRFFTGNIFEPRIFRKAINKKEIFMYYSVLNFINNLSVSINKVISELNI